MFSNKKPIRQRVAVLLVFLLILTSIPLTPVVFAADPNKTIELLSPVLNPNNTDSNPLLVYEPRITIKGELIANAHEIDKLRLRTKQQGDLDFIDQKDLAPTYQRNIFTFTEVSLKPGLNIISFYIDRGGNNFLYPYTVYIQYNTTPFLSELKINNTKLNEPWNENPTIVSIPSLSRMRAELSGIAKNADKLIIKNVTYPSYEEYQVAKTGVFSMHVPVILGENIIEIYGYSNNKEVALQQYRVIVTTETADAADQFYQVTLENDRTKEKYTLNHQEPTVSIGQPAISPNPGDTFNITGEALLKFVHVAGERELLPPAQFPIKVRISGNGVNQEVDATYTIKPDAAQPGYTAYSIKAGFTLDADITLVDGAKYDLDLVYSYNTFQKDENGVPDLANPTLVKKTVNNYKYQFIYADASKPRFKEVYNNTNITVEGNKGALLTPFYENVITDPIPILRIDYHNMTKTDLSFYYNNSASSLVENVDYTLIDGPLNSGYFYITLNKLPTGLGKLDIYYKKGVALEEKKVTYLLNLVVTPYIYAYYKPTANELVSVEDGFQYTDSLVDQALNLKVYNFNLSNMNDIEVRLNNKLVQYDSDDPDTDNPAKLKPTDITNGAPGEITIPFANKLWQDELRSGSNQLYIQLKSNPRVTFTYNISYLESTTPTINNVRLYLDKKEELKKEANDINYRTDKLFLNGFTFDLDNATKNTQVYVEKNGQRIITYTNDGTIWEDPIYPDLSSTLGAPGSTLDTFYKLHNFTNEFNSLSNSKFSATMANVDYGDLLGYIDVLNEAEKNNILNAMPLTLSKSGETTYTIVVTEHGSIVARTVVSVVRTAKGWEIITPNKQRASDPYIIINANTVPIKIFAENASKVTFGKTEAKVRRTTNPDFKYDDDTGRILPQNYYVFEATVPLKIGLNKIAFTVEVNGEKYKDEILIYNVAAPINGAEYREVLGKKTTFSAFDKNLELKFPKGTVLLSPPLDRPGDEIRDLRSEIFVDTELYFGVANRTTGQVTDLGGSNPRMTSYLELPIYFSYASPLYFIDSGDMVVPGGRDPYFADDNTVSESERKRDFLGRYDENLMPSNRGTLTLKYDPSIVNATKNNLTIFYHNGDYQSGDYSNGWQNLGGVVDVGKKTITVPFKGFGYYMVMKTRELFSDMLYHDYARVDMEIMFAKGLMDANPYSLGQFGAYDRITRGEMAQILVKALDLPINAGPYSDRAGFHPIEPTFSDVRPSRDTWDYQYKYIETAARAGIINGKNPGFFEPYESLTRQEAAIMITRAMNLKLSKSPEDADKKLAKSFTDSKDIGYYAKQSVEAVTKAGIMKGAINDTRAAKPTYSFLPTATLTRAEMAVITVRILTQLKKLPK